MSSSSTDSERTPFSLSDGRNRKPRSSKKAVRAAIRSLRAVGAAGGVTEISVDDVERLDLIATGRHGQVWRGRCRHNNVAIKVYRENSTNRKDLDLDRIRNEVEVLSRAIHPNVVLLLGFCVFPTGVALVSELVEHGSIDDLIHAPNAATAMSLHQRIKLLLDVARGLNWLHCSNPRIVHCDVHAANLLLDNNWNVKICNFGEAQIGDTPRLYNDMNVLSTVDRCRSMAPELLLHSAVDEKVDVYSFGIVAWEVVTGTVAFDEFDCIDSLKRALGAMRVRPSLELVPPLMSHLLAHCWASRPADRPLLSDVVRALERVASDCVIDDPVGRRFWRRAFRAASVGSDGSATVEWHTFSRAFARALDGEQCRFDIVRSATLEAIKQLIATNRPLVGEYGLGVTAESFGRLLDWFGPLDAHFVSRMSETVRRKWFHGAIDATTANTRLATAPRLSFLVRCSATNPFHEPFVLSRKTADNTICHQRISFCDKSMSYAIAIRNPDGTLRFSFQGERNGSLSDFVAMIQTEMGLTSTPGAPFRALYSANCAIGYV